MREVDVVALVIMHSAVHAVVAFAKTQVIGGVVFGGFALGPVPVATILDIHHVEGMAADDFAIGLQAKIVYAGNALCKNLRSHDGAAD